MKTRIRQVLTHKGREVHSVQTGSSVTDAAKKMTALGIGAMLVLDRDRVAGIITERDLARRVCAGNVDLTAMLVEEVMTSPVAYVTPETTVGEAMRVMSTIHCRHLPVIADGDLIGVLSLGDLIRWLTVDLEEHVRYLEGYIQQA